MSGRVVGPSGGEAGAEGVRSLLGRGVSPSLLSANFLDLAGEVERINASEAAYLHLDIMDGVFVPNISFGFPVVEAVHRVSEKPLDVHLMIVEPERYVQRFSEAGATILTVHWETSPHLVRTLQAIREAGMYAGVSLNPHAPVEWLEGVFEYADLFLIMSVNPGFGGQRFLSGTLDRVERLRTLADRGGWKGAIEVDGGVNAGNAGSLYAAGADILVAGNAVFSQKDVEGAIRDLMPPEAES